jgi:hypothetical protein
MGLLTKIANRKTEQAANTLADVVPQMPEPASQPPVLNHWPSPFPKSPPMPCLICQCPIAWVTTYDLESDIPPAEWQLRCGECDPPPGRSVVGAKWIVKGRDDGKLMWWRFDRGPDWSAGGPDDPGPADRTTLADWSGWHELTLPDGHTMLAPPGWRRLNLTRLEHRYGIDRAWQMLQERTEKFFERERQKQAA